MHAVPEGKVLRGAAAEVEVSPSLAFLRAHTDPRFPGYDLSIPDQVRADLIARYPSKVARKRGKHIVGNDQAAKPEIEANVRTVIERIHASPSKLVVAVTGQPGRTYRFYSVATDALVDRSLDDEAVAAISLVDGQSATVWLGPGGVAGDVEVGVAHRR